MHLADLVNFVGQRVFVEAGEGGAYVCTLVKTGPDFSVVKCTKVLRPSNDAVSGWDCGTQFVAPNRWIYEPMEFITGVTYLQALETELFTRRSEGREYTPLLKELARRQVLALKNPHERFGLQKTLEPLFGGYMILLKSDEGWVLTGQSSFMLQRILSGAVISSEDMVIPVHDKRQVVENLPTIRILFVEAKDKNSPEKGLDLITYDPVKCIQTGYRPPVRIPVSKSPQGDVQKNLAKDTPDSRRKVLQESRSKGASSSLTKAYGRKKKTTKKTSKKK